MAKIAWGVGMVVVILAMIAVAPNFIRGMQQLTDIITGVYQWNTGVTVPRNANGKTHAEENHPEAVAIRECLNRPETPRMVYKDRTGDRFYLPCQFEPGRWGIQVVDKNGKEVTAFAKNGTGTWRETLGYLERKMATKFNGKLPWLTEAKGQHLLVVLADIRGKKITLSTIEHARLLREGVPSQDVPDFIQALTNVPDEHNLHPMLQEVVEDLLDEWEGKLSGEDIP